MAGASRSRATALAAATVAVLAGAFLAPAAAPAQVITVADDSVLEHTGGEIWFDLTRAPATGLTTVPYTVTSGSAVFPDDFGTATENDPSPGDGILTFNNSVGSLRVTVPVVNDSLFEPDEDLFLDLGPPANATVNDPDNPEARGVIVADGDTPPQPPANPLFTCTILSCLPASPNLISILGLSYEAKLQLLIREAVARKKTAIFYIAGFFPAPGILDAALIFVLGNKVAGASAAAPIATARTVASAAGQQQIGFTLTRQGKKQLRKKGKATLSLTMRFTDNSGASVTDSSTIQFKGKKAKKK